MALCCTRVASCDDPSHKLAPCDPNFGKAIAALLGAQGSFLGDFLVVI